MVIGIFESWIFIKILSFGSDDCQFSNIILDLPCLSESICKRLAVVKLHRLVTTWAVQEFEHNSCTCPFIFYDSLQAVDVEHMTTAKLDTRLCSKFTNVANRAVRILVDSFEDRVWWIFQTQCSRLCSSLLSTFLIQARKTLLFAEETMTSVSTRQDFLTTDLH